MDHFPFDDLLAHKEGENCVEEEEEGEEKGTVLHPAPDKLARNGWSGLVGDQSSVV